MRYDPSMVAAFTQDLRKAPFSSVDAFLESRREYIDIGRRAIAFKLIPCERQRRFHFPAKKGEEIRSGDWYRLLCCRMWTEFLCHFGQNKVSILTFNYDRSLEYYLCEAMQAGYGATEDECAEQLKKIDIIHLHGSLGRLPWQSRGPQHILKYDGNIDWKTVAYGASGIKIIHESAADDPEFKEARALIAKAHRIYCLGFGYHHDNVERLGLTSTPYTNIIAGVQRIFAGTSVGMRTQEVRDVRNYCPVDITAGSDEDCLGFFREEYALD